MDDNTAQSKKALMLSDRPSRGRTPHVQIIYSSFQDLRCYFYGTQAYCHFGSQTLELRLKIRLDKVQLELYWVLESRIHSTLPHHLLLIIGFCDTIIQSRGFTHSKLIIGHIRCQNSCKSIMYDAQKERELSG